MFAVVDAPFKVAVTVALALELIEPAVAVKVAELALAATLIEAGTVSAPLLDANVTVVATFAGEFSVTVHVLVAPEASVVGEH